MKPILVLAAAAGLLAVAACDRSPPNAAQENSAESDEANADSYQDAAEDTSNAVLANADAVSAPQGNAAEPVQNGL